MRVRDIPVTLIGPKMIELRPKRFPPKNSLTAIAIMPKPDSVRDLWHKLGHKRPISAIAIAS